MQLHGLSAEPLSLEIGFKGQNSNLSEHDHVSYQIKWNHKYSNIVANSLPADHPHRPRGWGQNVKIQLIPIMVMLQIKLNQITNAAIW